MNKFLEFIVDTLFFVFRGIFPFVIAGSVALPVLLLLRSLGLSDLWALIIADLCGFLAFFILFKFLTRNQR